MYKPFDLPEDRGSSIVQQTTRVEFENPEHPDVWKDSEMLQQNFDAALWLKHRFGSRRDEVVGAFILALQAEMQENHPEDEMPLDELVRQLREQYIF